MVNRIIEEKLKDNLYALSKANNYLRFQFDKIKPFVGRRILEIGPGVGNITQHILTLPHDSIMLVEKELFFVEQLQKLFENKVEILHIDLNDIENYFELLKSKKNDTIIAINVLEHIEDDFNCLKALSSILEKGGRIIIIVPAFKFFFSKLDTNYGHFRRYVKSLLVDYSHKLNLTLIENTYFDIFGWFGWFILVKVLRINYIPNACIGIFNKMTPLVKMIEDIFPSMPFGLSLLGVFEK